MQASDWLMYIIYPYPFYLRTTDPEAQEKPPTPPASTSRERGAVPKYSLLHKSSDEEGKFL